MIEDGEDGPSRQQKINVVIELYKEQCAHGRHTESQRHAVSAMFLTGAGALIAVMGAMKFSWQTFPLALCVIFLGIYAKIFVGVYAIKWTELSDRRNHYREEMERLSRTCKIPNDKDSAFKNKQK